MKYRVILEPDLESWWILVSVTAHCRLSFSRETRDEHLQIFVMRLKGIWLASRSTTFPELV